NTDRLGRYSNSWYSILKVFLDYSVELYVGESTKPYDFNNPNDKLSIGILSLVSQYDNELRRLRSVMGKRNSLRIGNSFVGGTVPFGYSVKGKNLVINKEESETIKELYKMYRDGKTTMDLKSYLDNRTDFHPKRSKSGWNIGTIQKMLRSTLYKGYQTWDWKENIGGEVKVVESIKVKTPQIVSVKLWDEVQKKILLNQKHRTIGKLNVTLFDGLLFCKSCKVKLSIREKDGSKHSLYSCRSVEYKWKNPQKWSSKHSNCTLKKSLRIEETDRVLLNHVIKVIKDSKKIREDYKLRNLIPKFEDSENLRKIQNTKRKYINEKRRYVSKLEDDLVDIEFKILSNELRKDRGKKLKLKVTELISNVEEEIQGLERELTMYSKSTEWIDWINQMYLEIDSVEQLPLKKQRNFLNDYLQKVDVEYLPNSQSHRFNFEFKYPIIEDEIEIDGHDKDGRRLYHIKEGKFFSNVEVPLKTGRERLNQKDKEILHRLISKLRIEEKRSLSYICEELNQKKILTPTNKRWDKPKLSSYIKNMKVDVGK
ncbi:recombinase family protein, partial [Bacteroidia bacterium]|nr:recombinase family protein [Bacteroidia bacterium]